MTTETQTFSPPHLHTEWVMVPKKMDATMLEAARNTLPGPVDICDADIEDIYETALSAAPPPPVTTREAEDLVHSQLPAPSRHQSAVTQAWMPIETAPKDGTEILLWTEHGVRLAYWEKGHALFGDYWFLPTQSKGIGQIYRDGVTHWMPLPLPPDDRTNVSVAQDSCLNQTLIDSAVSTAIERCAKYHDEQASMLQATADKHAETGMRHNLLLRASGHRFDATAIRALSTGGKYGQ